MVNRQRDRKEGSGQYEYYEAYRNSLKEEAVLEKLRLKGKWQYRCHLHGNRPYVNETKKK